MSSDTYHTKAGIAVAGHKPHVHDNTFQQIWNEAGMDLPKLTEELGRLRNAMKREAPEGTPERDAEIGAVASAEKAAAQGDGATALQFLKATGKWTLGIAEKIGVAIAAKAIEVAAGIGGSA